MPMVQVNSMTKSPSHCIVCREGSSADGPKPAIDLNVDYDFGSNAYLCEECGHLIATMLGYIDLTKVQKLTRKLRETKEELAAAKGQLAEQGAQLAAIREGSKAMKKVKSAA